MNLEDLERRGAPPRTLLRQAQREGVEWEPKNAGGFWPQIALGDWLRWQSFKQGKKLTTRFREKRGCDWLTAAAWSQEYHRWAGGAHIEMGIFWSRVETIHKLQIPDTPTEVFEYLKLSQTMLDHLYHLHHGDRVRTPQPTAEALIGRGLVERTDDGSLEVSVGGLMWLEKYAEEGVTSNLVRRRYR